MSNNHLHEEKLSFHSLEDLYPHLALEWHKTKNDDLLPSDVSSGSNLNVYWKCSKCGYEWKSKISNRVYNNNGCPACSGRIAIPGINDLKTINSTLAKEWNYDKNEGLLPSQVKVNSNKRIWWKCSKCAYEWEASIYSRNKGNGCPLCSGKIVVSGVNDICTLFPNLANEWNYEKNGDLKPSSVSKGYGKVWWICKFGHEWEAAVYSRIKGHNCPICNRGLQTSFAEQAVYFYVKKIFTDAINGCRTAIKGKELDIYIPSKKIGIEYDGEKWHQDIEKDSLKNKLCEESEIILYRIREKKCWFWTENQYLHLIPCSAYDMNELENSIKTLLIELCNDLRPVDVNIERDKEEIINYRSYLKIKNNIQELQPDIMKEWHPTKNGKINPLSVSIGSNSQYWWICDKGHSYKMSPSNKVKGKGCPYCANKKVLLGFNDLSTTNPDLSAEWNYTKNGELLPNQFVSGSNKKVWWKCSKCGYEWVTQINSRNQGRGCPNCSGRMKKKVVCIETNIVYNSAREAANAIGLKSRKSISECCLEHRKSAGGYHWKYCE